MNMNIKIKHKDFKTGKGDFLLIEDDNLDYDAIHDSRFKHLMYELFEKFEQLTEEKAREVVDESIHSGLFACYIKEVNPPNVYRHKCPFKSMRTLLKSLDVHFKNPYGEKPKRINAGIGGISIKRHEENKKQINDWEEAQSKVWNKSNTYLFKKI